MNSIGRRSASILRQVSGPNRVHVVTRAATGIDYPLPASSIVNRGYVLPCRVASRDVLPSTGSPTLLDEGDTETVVFCQSWHPPGTELVASMVEGQLYAPSRAMYYNVRVYESDGSTRWSADSFGWWSNYDNLATTARTKVAACNGRVFAIGPTATTEFGVSYGLVIYDADDGTVLNRIPLQSPLETRLADGLDVRLNGTPPLYDDATQVWVFVDYFGPFSFEYWILKFDLDGNYVGAQSVDTPPEGPPFAVRPDGFYTTSVYGFNTAQTFGDDLSYAYGHVEAAVSTNSLTWVQADLMGLYFVATTDERVDTALLDATVAAVSIQSDNLLAAHTRTTRLIGGAINGSTGTSATGAISMWDHTGNCNWLKDVVPGSAIDATGVTWLSDGSLLVTGQTGVVSKMTNTGTHVWSHQHMVANNCVALPNGAAAVGGSRTAMSSDVSYILRT